MRYFSLFSGIGGFELGIQKAIETINLRSIQQENSERPKTQHSLANKLDGWECVGYSEINKYAIQIYKKHFPRCKNYGNAKRIVPEELPNFDLFTFGWPCQDNSIAGKRKGQGADTRSGLLFEAIRILWAKKPKYFIAENVEGLFSVNEGYDFYTTIEMFADIGYDCQWQLLNTSWFLPQNRKRIFFIGHIRGQYRPKIFPIQTTNRTYSESSNKRRVVTSAITTENAHQFGKNMTAKQAMDIATCLDANYGKGWFDHRQKTMIQVGQVGKKDNMGQRIYNPDGIACSIRSQGGGQGAKTGLYVIKKHRKDEIRNHKQTCPTLTESHEHYGGANVPMVVVPNVPNGQIDKTAKKRNNVADKIKKSNREASELAQGILFEETSEGDIRKPGLRKQDKEDSGIHRRMLLARMPETLQGAEKQQKLLDSKNKKECTEKQDSEQKTQKAGLENNKNMGTRTEKEPKIIDLLHIREEGKPREYTKIAPTLNQRDYKEPRLVDDGMKIRRLTPVECERLQGFPDGWTEWGIDENGKKVKISDTQRYRTLGNAVTTDVVAEIVKRLIQNL